MRVCCCVTLLIPLPPWRLALLVRVCERQKGKEKERVCVCVSCVFMYIFTYTHCVCVRAHAHACVLLRHTLDSSAAVVLGAAGV